MTRRGETVTDWYIRHPPAASGWLPDGAPLDSGTAHILHSNASTLSGENLRLIGHARGPGPVDVVSTQGAWGAIFDITPDTGADVYGEIPWTQPACAMAFGPIAAAFDHISTAPAGLVPRRIRVVVQATKGPQSSTSLKIMAVVTSGPDTPLRATRVVTASQTYTAAASVLCDLVLELPPIAPGDLWRGRETSSAAPASTPVAPLWVWVGWSSNSTAGGVEAVESVSVFEVTA
jgi:hypothetical protein